MHKYIVRFTLCVLVFLSVFSLTVFAERTMKFKDVKSTDWFYDYVKQAYENGLINGKSETEFAPDDNITFAEVVTLAARMNQRYNYGEATQLNGNPWYKPYVDYCKERGIIKKDYNWSSLATRADFMEIFANTLPEDMLEVNSYVPDGSIPDVPMTHPQASGIYKLYRAGILKGVNDKYYCNPSAYITRKEVAVVLQRMTYPETREVVIITDHVYIKKQPQNVSAMKGDDVVFSAEAASGVEPYTYQWYYSKDNGDTWNVHNSKKEKLIFTVTDFSWIYKCVVKDATGAVNESNYVKVIEIPSDLGCKYRLSDVTAAPGDKVKLTMEAVRGKAPYTYQWQCRYTPNGRGRYTDWMDVDGLHIGGNTSSMYFYAIDSTFSEFYQYRCKITDATGAVVYSSTVSMIGKYAPLTVDIQPIDKNVSYGETTTFTVNVTGGLEPYTYRWRVSDNDGFRWTDIYGEKTSKLTVTGIYENLKYSCVVTDATGKSVSSPAAFLYVKNALRIASQPKNVAAVKGMSAVFDVTVAGGKSPYSYQWEYRYIPQGMADYTGWTKVGTWGAGAKSNSLAITVNSYEFDNAYQYRCVITDSAGNKLTTNTVYVTMK